MWLVGGLMDDVWPIAQAAGGVLALMMPLIWRLASRLQKMESANQSNAEESRGKLEGIEADLSDIKEAQNRNGEIERGGRKELWVEISAIRERVVKIETKLNGG